MFGKHVLAAAAVIGVAAFGGHSAMASIITQGPLAATSSVVNTKTDWVGNIVLPKFNSSLGQLLSVQITITDVINTTLSVTASGSTNATGGIETKVSVGISDPLGLFGQGVKLTSTSGIATSSLFQTSTQTQFYNVAPGTTTPITPPTANGSGTTPIFTAADVLAEFTGTGGITLVASTLTNAVNTTTSGNSSATQSTFASATGTVTYTYRPAAELPEPFSVALLGSAVVGFGVLRRRFS